MENKIIVRKYEKNDLPAMIRIWNEVVDDAGRKISCTAAYY